MVDWFTTPVLIPTRDRLTDLGHTLRWLAEAGYHSVHLIDNGSTYPPLVDWLSSEEAQTYTSSITYLRENVGSRSPWLPQFDHLRDGFYCVTDPDIVPIPQCPPDLVAHLAGLLEAHPEVPKAGVGLYIRDVDNKERYREQLWSQPDRWTGDCFRSPVETTLALYRPGIAFSFDAVRSAHPYLARHLPWYRESALTEEDKWYLRHAKPSGFDLLGRATGGSDWASWATV